VSLSAPFKFNREDASKYSLIELKTMQELGGPEKLKDWKATGEREMFIPERASRQQALADLEKERLRHLGLKIEGQETNQLPHLLITQQRAAKIGS
jgi:hypothetical protein